MILLYTFDLAYIHYSCILCNRRIVQDAYLVYVHNNIYLLIVESFYRPSFLPYSYFFDSFLISIKDKFTKEIEVTFDYIFRKTFL